MARNGTEKYRQSARLARYDEALKMLRQVATLIPAINQEELS